MGPPMKQALAAVTSGERDEVEVESGLSYASDRPVRVRVRRRDHRYDIDDDGAAVRLAGEPAGWLGVAEGLMKAHGLNINGRGVVFVPAVEGQDLEALVLSVADTSVALYSSLLDSDFAVE